MAKLRQSVKKI